MRLIYVNMYESSTMLLMYVFNKRYKWPLEIIRLMHVMRSMHFSIPWKEEYKLPYNISVIAILRSGGGGESGYDGGVERESKRRVNYWTKDVFVKHS